MVYITGIKLQLQKLPSYIYRSGYFLQFFGAKIHTVKYRGTEYQRYYNIWSSHVYSAVIYNIYIVSRSIQYILPLRTFAFSYMLKKANIGILTTRSSRFFNMNLPIFLPYTTPKLPHQPQYSLCYLAQKSIYEYFQ